MIVAIVIGIAVTLIAVLNPALRSTRVPPIAAMQNLELTASRRRSIVTVAIAWLLMIAGSPWCWSGCSATRRPAMPR